MSRARPATILVHMNREPVDALGEIFMRLPFLRALREWAPQAKITIVPGLGGASFWEDLLRPITSTLVDEFIRTEIPRPPRKFDWVFDMEGDARLSWSLRRLARRRFHTTAWRGWLNLPHPPLYHGKHVAKRYLGVLRQATGAEPVAFWPWPMPYNYRRAAERILPAGREYVALVPGAGRQLTGKCWPVERYAEVARRQAELGRVPLVLLGGNEPGWEKHFAGVPEVRFPLAENRVEDSGVPSDPVFTAAIGERVAVAVSNCCGTGHMLALGGAPLVSLFGPSSAKKFHPLARVGAHLHPTEPPGTDIRGIPLAAVLAAIEDVRARARPLSSTSSASVVS